MLTVGFRCELDDLDLFLGLAMIDSTHSMFVDRRFHLRVCGVQIETDVRPNRFWTRNIHPRLISEMGESTEFNLVWRDLVSALDYPSSTSTSRSNSYANVTASNVLLLEELSASEKNLSKIFFRFPGSVFRRVGHGRGG